MAGNSKTINIELAVDDKGTVSIKQFADLNEKSAKKTESAWSAASSTIRRRLKDAFKVAAAGIVGVTAAGAAGTVALLAISKSTAATGDSFQKMALRTGVSTEMLSGLAHAADLSGSSIMDVETGLKQVAKRMADAERGGKESVRMFDSLGIKVSDSSGRLKSADVILLEVADKISRMKDETAAAAIAQELFGRSGTTLLPLLKSGKDGIMKMTAETWKLGTLWTQIEANASADFIDAMDRMNKTGRGLKETIAKLLIPSLTDLSNEGTEIGQYAVAWLNANKGRVLGFLEEARNKTIELMRSVRDSAPELKQFAEDLFNIGQAALTAAAKIVSFVNTLGRGLGEAAGRVVYGPLFEEQLTNLKVQRSEIKKNLDAMQHGENGIFDVLPAAAKAKQIKLVTDEYNRLGREIKIMNKIQVAALDPPKPITVSPVVVPDAPAGGGTSTPAPDPAPTFTPSGGGAGGGSSVEAAKKSAEERLQIEQDLLDKINQLRMTDNEYSEWSLDQQVQQMRAKYGDMAAIAEYEKAKKKEIANEKLAAEQEFQLAVAELSGNTTARALADIERQKQAFIQSGIDRVQAEKWAQEAIKKVNSGSQEISEEWGIVTRNMENAVVGFATNTTNTWSSMIQSMYSEMTRLLTHKVFQMIFGGGLFGGGGGGSTGISFAGPLSWLGGLIFHDGGGVGYSSVPSRRLPASFWDMAPRLHDGLKPDEFPAILQYGEEVKSRDGVKADRAEKSEQNALLREILGALQKGNSPQVVIVQPESAEDYVNSHRGEQKIVNLVRRNRASLF